MKHCGVSRNLCSASGGKKIPLNTIVLPPLSPNLIENAAQLVLVNKAKSGVSGEILNLSGKSQDGTPRLGDKIAENVRIVQLEQNIKFLQDQHQIMLNDLHNEIEILRGKNRDLQFQLICNSPGQTSSSQESSSTSSDDEHKISSTPNQPPFTSSLHVELLEKMIGDMKIQLQDNESRNVYLSAIVDEQKKKLDKYERERERERERAVQAEPELRRKVEEAEFIIRRLQQENNTLRQENSTLQSPPNYHHHHRDSYYGGQRGENSQSRDSHLVRENHHSSSHHNSQHRDNNSQHHHNKDIRDNYHHRGKGNRRNNPSANFRGNWFPPLHSHGNYWQSENKISNNHEKNGIGPTSENVLPNLQFGNGSSQKYREKRSFNNNQQSAIGPRKSNTQNKDMETL